MKLFFGVVSVSNHPYDVVLTRWDAGLVLVEFG